MREAAVVAFAQAPSVRREDRRNEVEMLMPVVREALDACGLTKSYIGFFVSGSSDYLAGASFAFVHALDAVGAWPPIQESHVEMDGAWALYEAWVRLLHGDVDTALVYAFGRSSLGDLRDVLAMQLDPYYTAPLWPDSVSLAALQARALLDAGRATERAMSETGRRGRGARKGPPRRAAPGGRRGGRSARRAVPGLSAPPARLPAHLRRRLREGARGGRPRPPGVRPPRLDPGDRSPHRAA